MKNFTICLTLLAVHFCVAFGQTVIANYTQQIDHLAIAREGNVVWLSAPKEGVLKCDLAGNVLERYTTANGLAGNTVYDILIDQQGRRWFATDGGISVLDAANVWTQHPFYVKSLAQSANGDFWAAGYKTSVLDAVSGIWTTYDHFEYDLKVKISADNTVYVGGKRGMAVRNPLTLEWTYYNTYYYDPYDGYVYDPVKDFEFDAQGNLWVIKDYKLFTFADSVFTPVEESLLIDLPNTLYAFPTAMVKTSDGRLLIGTQNGIWIYDGTPIIQEVKSGPGFRATLDFAVENDGSFRFSSDLGFSFYDGTSFEHYFPGNHTLKSENVFKILIDESGRKWFLGNAGRTEFDNTLWAARYGGLADPIGLPLDASFEPDGTKWFMNVSINGVHLARLQGDSINIFPASVTGLGVFTRIGWDPVKKRTIFKTSMTDSEFWYHENDSLKSFIIPQSLLACEGLDFGCSNGNAGEIRQFFISPDGYYVWANPTGYFYTHQGYSDELMQDTIVYSCGHDRYPCSSPSCACNNTHYVAFDNSGRTWYASDAGIYVYSGFDGIPQLYFTVSNSGLPNDTVQCIVFDATGRTWVGTRNGLAILDTDLNWTVLNKDNAGLAGNSVRSVAFDTDGSAWIGTETGVSHMTSTTWTTETPTAANQLAIFPNPATERITIISENEPITALLLTDIQGKQLQFSEGLQFPSTNVSVDLRDYPAGVYLIRTQVNHGWKWGKIVKY